MNAKLLAGLVVSSVWVGCGGNVVADPNANADAGSSVNPTNPAPTANPTDPTPRATSHCASMTTKAKECQDNYNSSQCTNEAVCIQQVFSPSVSESILKCAESGTCRTGLDDCVADASQRTTVSAAAKTMQAKCSDWARQCHSRMNCDLDGYTIMSDTVIAGMTKCFDSGCGGNVADCMRTQLSALSPACASVTGNGNNTPPNGGGGGPGSNGGSGGGGAPTPTPADAGTKPATPVADGGKAP